MASALRWPYRLPAQVDQLADMLSSVFLVHSGSNLQTFPTLNVTDVILATEMSIEAFFQQVCRQQPCGKAAACLPGSGLHTARTSAAHAPDLLLCHLAGRWVH